MPKVVCVAGARPNFVKIKPILDALEKRAAETVLVHTGQHYDSRMSDVFFAELGIRAPDHTLNVGSATHGVQTGRVMAAFESVLDLTEPDIVVVVGDVNSTLACAIVAAKAGSLVAHVEAGLRSRDWGMPEEVNRVATDRVSDYLFATSLDAADNLRHEGYRDDQIHLVGNVMVDTLMANVGRARPRPILEDLGIAPGKYGLVTLHRPSTVDEPAVLGDVLAALSEIGRSCPLVFPVHPRTRQCLNGATPAGMLLIDPVGYLDFLSLESQACVVLTDSGGVQEETTVLGVPCLTLRENTERPITVAEGTNRVVGRDREGIVAAAIEVLTHPPTPRSPTIWDGHAGERIAAVLIDGGTATDRRRPTS